MYSGLVTFSRTRGYSAINTVTHTTAEVVASWLANRKSITVSAMALSVVWWAAGTFCSSASLSSSRQRCAQKSIRQRGWVPSCKVRRLKDQFIF